MPLISSDQIRDISVKSVEAFLNQKIPLSEGLAKQASALELNSEQIHRAVEATNSIAYLKILQLSDDRTVEFPLCKYAEVMRSVTLPNMDFQKVASEQPQMMFNVAPNVSKTLSHTELEKIASDAENKYMKELTHNEKYIHFIKMASENDAMLARLKDRELTIVADLTKAASVIKKDVQGLEKLAAVVDGPEFSVLSKLVFNESKTHANTGIFKKAELEKVYVLTGLLKEAQELHANIKEAKELSERSSMVKQAFLGKAIGGAVGAIGSGIGKAIGSVASIPFKVLGKGLDATASNVKSQANATFQTGANKVRQAMGKPTVAIPKVTKRFGLGAAAGMAGLAATDALMYSPGTNKETGRSKDAWDALQRQN